MAEFYHSRAWKHKRELILRRDGYICQLNKRYGKTVQAETVHHIFPLKEFPQFALESWNLISVSNEMHNRLHDRETDKLTAEGWNLLIRTAKKRGIDVEGIMPTRTLVIGLPGTGKTTWCKHHLQDGIAYDLDLIAQAFRLGDTDRHEGSRRMANDLLIGFASNAGDYSARVFIIRTAPSIEELEELAPSRVVYCKHQYADRGFDTRGAQERIEGVLRYCKKHSIPVIEPPPLPG